MNALYNMVSMISNYKPQNQPNLFNLLYDTYELIEDKDKDKYKKLIKKNLGLTIYEEWIFYCHRKGLIIN